MDPSLVALRRLVRRRTALIDAPESVLPTYVTSEQSADPTSSGRAMSCALGVTFSMATSWEAAHRQPHVDFRRGLFVKQLERLNPEWAQRFRHEKVARLREVGLG